MREMRGRKEESGERGRVRKMGVATTARILRASHLRMNPLSQRETST